MSNFLVNTPSYQYGALWHSPCPSDCGSMNQDEDCCSVTESCLALSDLMNCSTSGFPVLHYLPEFRQGQGPLRVSSSQEWTCLCILVVLSHRLGVACGKGSLSTELPVGDSESEV